MHEAGLSSRYYTDPQLAALEQQRIFDRAWQVVGHVSELPRVGSRIVGRLGRSEVVVVRGEDGAIRAHVNTCRHRGTRLVSGPGCEKAIRCPSHGWTYDLDGEFVGAPEGRTTPTLDRSKLALLGAKAEVFCNLVFVTLDPRAAALAPQLAGLRPLLQRYLGGEMEPFGEHRINADKTSQVRPSNWKLVVDTYLEGYGQPFAKPGLARFFDHTAYSVETSRAYAAYDVPLRENPSGNRGARLYRWFAQPMRGLTPDDGRTFRRVAIYPNAMIDLYPDQVRIRKANPLTVDTTGVSGTYLRQKGCDTATRTAQRLDLLVEKVTTPADELLAGKMQRGLSYADFVPGPLSARETGVAWFAGRVREDLDELS